MMRGLAACVALLWALVAGAADAPRGPDGLLAVPPLARVTDTAGVLSAADRAALENKLAAFETEYGSQIAVLLVPSTQSEPIADFTNRVGADWKIGRRGVGDGVLVVVATQDRRGWISVARALEGAVPDVVASRIVRDTMGPHFKNGDYAAGLNAGLDQLFARIRGEALPAPLRQAQRQADAGEGALALLLPFVLVGTMFGAVLRRLLGLPGALLAGGGTGAVAGWMLSSLVFGGLAGLAVVVLALGAGSRSARTLGGRRGGTVVLPGGFGGGWSGGRGGWSGGGGWSSGGGGDFSGGGGGGNW